jgi:hypothetical protein
MQWSQTQKSQRRENFQLFFWREPWLKEVAVETSNVDTRVLNHGQLEWDLRSVLIH